MPLAHGMVLCASSLMSLQRSLAESSGQPMCPGHVMLTTPKWAATVNAGIMGGTAAPDAVAAGGWAAGVVWLAGCGRLEVGGRRPCITALSTAAWVSKSFTAMEGMSSR